MYIREKHFKNKDSTKRTYLNLVECEKIDGKVIQNNLVNFGRVGQPETLKKLKLAVEALLPLCDDYSIIDPSKDLSPEREGFGVRRTTCPPQRQKPEQQRRINQKDEARWWRWGERLNVFFAVLR